MNTKIKFIYLGVVLGFSLLSCSKKKVAEKEIPAYAVESAKSQDAELQSIFSVSIKGEDDVNILPRVNGKIKAVFVHEGEEVKAGQPLFEIDSPESEQQYLTAKAAVSSAEAQLHTATLNMESYKPLMEEGIISQVQYKTAVNAMNTAQAGLEQAKAALQNATQVKSWMTVTSPVNGRINNLPYRYGSLVNTSTLLTTIANTNNMFVYFSMSEGQLMNFLEGLPGNTQAEKINNIPPVTLTLKDGKDYKYKGKVRTIDGSVNSSTGATMLRADFVNPEGFLRNGYSGVLTIPKYLKNVVVIPQASTYNLQNKVFLYRFVGDSVAVSTAVDVLPMPNGKDYVVMKGLTPGEQYVVDGIATLKDGMKIKAKNN